MRNMIWKCSLALFSLSPIGFGRLEVEGAAQYSVQSLGHIGGTETIGDAINNMGIVAGEATSSNSGNPFEYSNGTFTTLSRLSSGAFDNSVNGLNDAGIAVGFSPDFVGYDRAVMWSNGVIQVIPNLTGYLYGDATAINSSNSVVGYDTQSGSVHAFLYQSGVVTDLGTLGGTTSYADDINDSGTIVGRSTDSNGNSHAFLYSSGKMVDLNPTAISNRSAATSINEAGQIVGTFFPMGNSIPHAAEWLNGQMTDLGIIDPTEATQAYAINNFGEIVGTAGSRAALIVPNGITYLDSFIPSPINWTLSYAQAINDEGQIVVTTAEPGSIWVWNTYLLTPAPEPASLAVMIVAFILLMRQRPTLRA